MVYIKNCIQTNGINSLVQLKGLFSPTIIDSFSNFKRKKYMGRKNNSKDINAAVSLCFGGSVSDYSEMFCRQVGSG